MPPLQVTDMTRRDAKQLGELGLGKAQVGSELGDVHAYSSHIASYSATGIPRNYVKESRDGKSHNARMAKKSQKPAANHLRAWREYRKMTQEELAEMVGTAGNVIGLLESGERGLSDKWLRKLAPALKTRPGFLLEFSPHDADLSILEAITDVAPERKGEALRLLKVFKTGTEG